MIKRYLTVLVAVAMLFTSCSQDETNEYGENGNMAQISFSIGMEKQTTLRTIGDGSEVDKLIYAIFNENGKRIQTIAQEVKTGVTFPTTVTMTLAKGQKYSIAFWAQDSDCKAYTVSDDMKVTIDYAGLNNDETRDAFFGAKTFDVSKSEGLDITLTRPFAQINVGVYQSDWDAAVTSGFTVKNSMVELGKAATTLNTLDGTVSGSTDVTYALEAIPTQLLQVDTDNDGVKEDFKYLSMCYILANDITTGAKPTALNTLKFTFEPEAGKPLVIQNGLAGATVQRNWRTNILGRMLTGDVSFTVKIDAIFEDLKGIPPAPFVSTEFNLAGESLDAIGATVSGNKITFTNGTSIETVGATAATDTKPFWMPSPSSGRQGVQATGFDYADGAYWLMTIPVSGEIAANTNLNLKLGLYGGGNNPMYWDVFVSYDNGTSWTKISDRDTINGKDRASNAFCSSSYVSIPFTNPDKVEDNSKLLFKLTPMKGNSLAQQSTGTINPTATMRIYCHSDSTETIGLFAE